LANIYNSAKGKVPSTSQPLNKKNGRTSGAEIKRKNRFFIQSLIRPFKKSVPNTPLRPHILAAFLPWGGFAGAGRPARRKGRWFAAKNQCIFLIKIFWNAFSVQLPSKCVLLRYG